MKKNIAIIGSGISGMTAAYLLSKKHDVTLFEKGDYLGGHTATVDVCNQEDEFAVDTGFIVFNERTYPNFLALLDEIGVGKQETEMSFSVQNRQSGFEYNGHNLDTLFAQRRNLFRPRFWRFILEILRFNRQCKALHESQGIEEQLTLGEYLRKEKFSEFFSQHYILPMVAAIWSASLEESEQLQLGFFIRFFYHHGLLDVANRPRWFVIPGGSREYISPLTRSFADKVHLNADISGISRTESGVKIELADGLSHSFDEVVLACHSDQALALLKDPSEQEEAVLGAIPYSANSVVLHTDTSLLPEAKKAWASWNYQLSDSRSSPASVTYNMNILQGLSSSHTYCVTLNQEESINPSLILKRFIYHHPVFNPSSSAAQQRRQEICGERHTHFAGAYWYNGFHEDGVRSAIDVAARFDCYLDKHE